MISGYRFNSLTLGRYAPLFSRIGQLAYSWGVPLILYPDLTMLSEAQSQSIQRR